MTQAIILDGGLKSALATVRSLAQEGIFMAVGAERKTAMALHSRHAGYAFVYPSPYVDRAAFARAVKAEAVRIGDRPLVYAFSDATWCALYDARTELEPYMRFIAPEQTPVDIVFNKAATYSFAKVSGVPTITTYLPETEEEVSRLAATFTYPAVVKTRRSVTWQGNAGVFGSASFVHTPEALVERFVRLKAKLGEAPIVQPLIIGEEYGVEMIAWEGEVRSRVVHHRIRSLSPTGGASVLKETIGDGVLYTDLVEHSTTLVKRLMWSGPIMVEWKVDSDSREPKLMEINGRFWGSLPLSIASGANMPYYYFRLGVGESLTEKVLEGRGGVVTRHFLGDVLHLMRVLFARDSMRKTHYPKRFRAIRDFFILPKGTKSDVWSWQDPLPAWYEIIDMIKKRIWK